MPMSPRATRPSPFLPACLSEMIRPIFTSIMRGAAAGFAGRQIFLGFVFRVEVFMRVLLHHLGLRAALEDGECLELAAHETIGSIARDRRFLRRLSLIHISEPTRQAEI